MPIRFNYDAQLKILFTTAEGLMSFSELERHLDEEDSAKALGYREIIDASAASTDLTSKEAKQLAWRLETLMRSGPLGPTAIVTTNDVTFGMARMLAIFCELWSGPQIGVFRSFDEGLNWLAHISPS
jgi:hypothetical protein